MQRWVARAVYWPMAGVVLFFTLMESILTTVYCGHRDAAIALGFSEKLHAHEPESPADAVAFCCVGIEAIILSASFLTGLIYASYH